MVRHATTLSPYWFGADVGERNLLGLGIAVGGGADLRRRTATSPGSARSVGRRAARSPTASLRGTRWGANGSLTLVHGSEPYRVAGDRRRTTPRRLPRVPVSPVRRPLRRRPTTSRARAAVGGAARSSRSTPTCPSRRRSTLPDGRDRRRRPPPRSRREPRSSPRSSASIATRAPIRSCRTPAAASPRPPRSARPRSAAATTSRRVFARYEHWWPLRDERHTIGMRLAGGVVIGDAPRFDRIHISDVDRMLTPRALGLVLSNAAPLDILGTRADKPSYGDARRQRDASSTRRGCSAASARTASTAATCSSAPACGGSPRPTTSSCATRGAVERAADRPLRRRRRAHRHRPRHLRADDRATRWDGCDDARALALARAVLADRRALARADDDDTPEVAAHAVRRARRRS